MTRRYDHRCTVAASPETVAAAFAADAAAHGAEATRRGNRVDFTSAGTGTAADLVTRGTLRAHRTVSGTRVDLRVSLMTLRPTASRRLFARVVAPAGLRLTLRSIVRSAHTSEVS